MDDRLKSAAVTFLVEGALIYALVMGLSVSLSAPPQDRLATFLVTPPPPPPPAEQPVHKQSAHRPKDAPAPPNRKAVATPIVAPPVPVIIPPPPIAAAPKPGEGTAPSAGAALFAGPGTGAGGRGNGLGGGGDGGDGDFTPPRWVKGRLKDSDYPYEAGDYSGKVGVRFAVEADGRVDDCRVTRSSGNAALDETTCRLIEKRYRYKPSLDPEGHPVKSYLVETHTWSVEPDEPR